MGIRFMFLAVDASSNNELGLSAIFEEQPAEILPQHAQGEQLNSGNNKQGYNQGGPACREIGVSQLLNREENSPRESCHGKDESENSYRAQGQNRKICKHTQPQ